MLLCSSSFLVTVRAPQCLEAWVPALITQPGQSRAGTEAFHSLSTHVREHYRTSCERKCKGLSHFYHYHHTTSRKGVCAQFCHVTEISCIRGALLGSFGSSLDSAAHLANFFMSVSPEVPIDEMASALFKALGGKRFIPWDGLYHRAVCIRTAKPQGRIV